MLCHYIPLRNPENAKYFIATDHLLPGDRRRGKRMIWVVGKFLMTDIHDPEHSNHSTHMYTANIDQIMHFKPWRLVVHHCAPIQQDTHLTGAENT